MPVFGRFKLTLITGITMIALSGCGVEPLPEVVEPEPADVETAITDPAINDLPNPNPTVSRGGAPCPTTGPGGRRQASISTPTGTSGPTIDAAPTRWPAAATPRTLIRSSSSIVRPGKF